MYDLELDTIKEINWGWGGGGGENVWKWFESYFIFLGNSVNLSCCNFFISMTNM